MKKKQARLEKEFRDIFAKLMFGSPAEFKEAKKRVSKLWHQDLNAFKDAAEVVFEYLPKFEQIENTKNQAAFASGLSMFYLTLADEYFDEFKNFTLKLLQSPHGHVREAIRKSADWLHVSLTSRIDPFTWPKGKKLTKAQKDERKQAKKQYIDFIKEIEDLIDQYEDDNGENVEYIDEMKPSVQKSLQMFLASMTEGATYGTIIAESVNTPPSILAKRSEIENEIIDMLKETESDFSLQDVKNAVFNEEEQNDMMKIVAMFDRGGDASELSNILELANEAWNYFPHKALDGLSPVEMSNND